MAKLYYYFKWCYKKDLIPTQEECDQLSRNLIWKGVEWKYSEKVPNAIEITDKGRGVQYKAFVKYFGASFDIKEISYKQYHDEWDTIVRVEREAERRRLEEEARLKEEERQRRIRDYKGPRKNPNFRWYGFLISTYGGKDGKKCFTPEEMRGWFSFLQDLWMAHGPINVFFWMFVFNFVGLGFVLYYSNWLEFFSYFSWVAGFFCYIGYLWRIIYTLYYFIKCYVKQLPIPEKFADFPFYVE